jgi:hypothetical protein
MTTYTQNVHEVFGLFKGFRQRWILMTLAVSLSLCFPFFGMAGAEALPAATPIDSVQKAHISNAYGQIPLYFVQNDGQIDDKVALYEKGIGHTTFFTKDGVYLSLTSPQNTPPIKGEGVKNTPPQHRTPSPLVMERIKLTFLNANKTPDIVAVDPQEGKVNYLIGKDPKQWKTNVPTYKSVLYKEVYPGIDIKFYGNNRQMEYDVVVKPGADPSQVRFSYEGIQGLNIAENGDLEIELKDGKMVQKKPVIYQEIDGHRVSVDGAFQLSSGETLPKRGFAYGIQLTSYDKTHPLVIDPTLIYSTYIGGGVGGSGFENGTGIAVDLSGNAYVMGSTDSPDFPLVSPLDGVLGGYSDAFVTKINAAGTALVYSTYLGGRSGGEYGNDIAVDGVGNAYVTGYTDSSDFPMVAPIDGVLGDGIGTNGDAFVAKINATGTALVYSTYLGGSDADSSTGLALDPSGNVYVTGYTFSTDFPLVFPLDGICAGCPASDEIFVTKINASGTALVYSTYLGGSDYDWSGGIAVDGIGNTYVTGGTASIDFPLVSPLMTTGGAFVTKINPSGTGVIYSTHLGGSGSYENGAAIAADSAGNAYVTGSTSSPDFPLVSPLDGTLGGGEDAFVTKINPAGTALVYSTFLGGSGSYDGGTGIAVDVSGNAYVTGYTYSTDFPLVSAIDGSCNGCIGVYQYDETFVTKINPAGTALVYSTYLGGSSYDDAARIAVDTLGNAYVTGNTWSSDFPVFTPIDGTLTGYQDTFVAKIGDSTAKLTNLSTRAQVQTGANRMIGGFQIQGATPKTVLIRARGGSMSGAPFNLSGTLTNPIVKLYSGSTVIAQNDNWQTTDPLCASPATSCGGVSDIIGTGKDPCQPNPGQSGPPPNCSMESALYVTLPPGSYSAITSGVGATSGLGMAEVFEVNPGDVTKLVNLSTRAPVLTGANRMIGGFIVSGTAPKTVLLRARGPSLGVAPFNLSGVLANPTVKLYSGSTVIAQNDDWQTTDALCGSPAIACGGVTAITSTGKDPCQPNPGQSGPPANCSKESAIYVTLPPGSYSAIVSGVGSTSGLGLVEVFEVN